MSKILSDFVLGVVLALVVLAGWWLYSGLTEQAASLWDGPEQSIEFVDDCGREDWL